MGKQSSLETSPDGLVGVRVFTLTDQGIHRQGTHRQGIPSQGIHKGCPYRPLTRLGMVFVADLIRVVGGRFDVDCDSGWPIAIEQCSLDGFCNLVGRLDVGGVHN